VQRSETRTRARALQILYAWDIQGRPPLELVAHGFATGNGLSVRDRNLASRLALAVADEVDALDREIEAVAEHWRLERIGVVERNILRLALHELKRPDLPAPVAINEAIRLARWFAGERAPAFVNGVLDALARRLGRL
jgi:N utilization substance protein B